MATTTTATTADVYLGMVFELQGEGGEKKEIVLEPLTAINKIQKEGIECTLPERVPLGTVGQNLDSLLTSIGSNMSESAMKETVEKAGIPAITRAYGKLMKAELNVEQFHVKIPPTVEKEKREKTQFTIGVSATWTPDPEEQSEDLPGTLTLRGIYFTVSNEKDSKTSNGALPAGKASKSTGGAKKGSSSEPEVVDPQ